MVRFHNAVVTIFAETTEENDDGDIIAEFGQVEVIEGDVQPHTLTEDEIKLYGISTSKGNVKLFLYNGYHENIKSGNRASVLSSFTGQTEWFNIMPVNAWSRHGECLLVPVENEVIEVPEESDGHNETNTEDDDGLTEETTEGGE